MGADFLEPDLSCTSDGVLVCRHEPEIADTTDVLDRFPGREPVVWEFTLAELKTLRARERLPALRGTSYDGQFEIPTFAELLESAARLGRGVYPETKHPERHAERGLALEPLVADALREFSGPVFLQSFSADSLRAMRGFGHPLVQLVGPRWGPVDFGTIAGYADAIGPNKELVDAAFVDAAHAAGLQVHPYTFRRENQFLPEDLRSSDDPAGVGDLRAEIARYRAFGIDGLFTDNPDLATF
jgi:glycerophosphoryl diester phosphodiesterase